MSLLSMCLSWLHLPNIDQPMSHCHPMTDRPVMIAATTSPRASSDRKCTTSWIRNCTAIELKPIGSDMSRRDQGVGTKAAARLTLAPSAVAIVNLRF